MNYSTAVFLINDSVRCIAATYEENGKDTLFKTLDPSIQVGDLVIVPTDTRHKMTVVKVTRVDVDVDLDAPASMDWVVDAVDDGEFKKVIDMEKAAIETIKSAERRKKRDDMREAIFRDREEMLKGLQLTDLSGSSASDDKSGGGLNKN